MQCSISSLCDKDVISMCDGTKIGIVGDVEFDIQSGCITCLIICGKQGFFGVGKTSDIRINWCDIEVIGDDTILVKCKTNTLT
ncbi:MAG: YlmC/YmxH family sporulation protein [Clostridia bacterium]|nr:YlmC/YmxH family sporulation protein [Clostridia bacterium]